MSRYRHIQNRIEVEADSVEIPAVVSDGGTLNRVEDAIAKSDSDIWEGGDR